MSVIGRAPNGGTQPWIEKWREKNTGFHRTNYSEYERRGGTKGAKRLWFAHTRRTNMTLYKGLAKILRGSKGLPQSK